jgi:hypothetical protein
VGVAVALLGLNVILGIGAVPSRERCGRGRDRCGSGRDQCETGRDWGGIGIVYRELAYILSKLDAARFRQKLYC